MGKIIKRVQPFSWNAVTINFLFTTGQSQQVNLAQFLRNPRNYPITYSISGTLPAGVTHASGVLTYNGVAGGASASVTIVASSGSYQATATGLVQISGGNLAPYWTGAPLQLSGSAGTVVPFGQYAVDPEGQPLTFAITVGNTNGYSINPSTGALTIGSVSQSLTISASDGSLSATTEVAVTVTGAAPTQTADYVDPVAEVTLLGGRTTVNVSSSSALTTALSNAVAGQTIQLAAGNYSGSFTLNKSVASNNPIIIKGAANWGSVVNGTLALTGTYCIVTGVFFSGSSAGIDLGGTNNKAIGNKITGWGSTTTIVKHAIRALRSSSRCEIAYNEIYSPGPWPSNPGPNDYPLRLGVRTQDDGAADFHYNGWCHHNFFHDFPDKLIPGAYHSGQSDAIEIGETAGTSYSGLNSGWYVEDNLVQDHLQAGAAAMDMKVGGVVARRNTCIRMVGNLDQRYGNVPSIYEANYLDNNCNGMNIRGPNMVVVGNRAKMIGIMAGNMACTDTSMSLGSGSAQLACNALVEGNTTTDKLRVGYAFTNHTLAASNTTVREHTGTVTLETQTGTNSSSQWTSPATRPHQKAVMLTTSQVGPTALATAPTSYKASRGL